MAGKKSSPAKIEKIAEKLLSGMNISQVADKMGISAPMVRSIRQGEHRLLSDETKAKLAKLPPPRRGGKGTEAATPAAKKPVVALVHAAAPKPQATPNDAALKKEMNAMRRENEILREAVGKMTVEKLLSR